MSAEPARVEGAMDASDTETSPYGPAPGLVPGGPNWYYDGTNAIPNRTYPA
jgi:hypothetical protein